MMTDPRLDFVPADLTAPGVVLRQLSAVFLFWARSFGMNGCTSADVILFLLPHSESSVWFLIQTFWRHSHPVSLQPVLFAVSVGGSEPPPRALIKCSSEPSAHQMEVWSTPGMKRVLKRLKRLARADSSRVPARTCERAPQSVDLSSELYEWIQHSLRGSSSRRIHPTFPRLLASVQREPSGRQQVRGMLAAVGRAAILRDGQKLRRMVLSSSGPLSYLLRYSQFHSYYSSISVVSVQWPTRRGRLGPRAGIPKRLR